MDAQEVFAKTEMGHDEVATRKAHLAPALRTALIMVDGKASVGSLLVQVAPLGVTTEAFDYLLAQGFIARARPSAPEPAPVAAPPTPTSRPAPLQPTAAQLTALRETLSELAYRGLGPDGEDFVIKIEKAKNLESIVKAAHDTELLLRKLGRHDLADAVAHAVGAPE